MKIKKFAIFNLILLIMFTLLSTKIQSTSYNVNSETSLAEKDISSWWWESLEVLSPEFTGNNYEQNLAVDSENNVHVVTFSSDNILSSGTDQDVFYKKFDYSTKIWSELELVSAESTSDSKIPYIEVDSENVAHVVWYDEIDILGSGTDYDIFYKQRTSSGWSSLEIVSTESTADSRLPSIVVDSSGICHVGWNDATDYLGSGGADYDIFYKFRNPSGVWSTTQLVSDLSSGSSTEVNLGLDDEENILFVWEDQEVYAGSGVDQDIFFRRLANDLTTWSPVSVVSSESTDESYSPIMSNEEGGLLHVVWYDYTDYAGAGGTDIDIFYKNCKVATNTWSITQVVSIENTGHAHRCDMVADGEDYVYVVWGDSTDIGGVGAADNIFFKYLDLETNIWSQFTVLTYEHDRHAGIPKIDIDGFNHLHVVWGDSTDLQGSGIDTDIFYQKFVGVPMTPFLNVIQPNPASVGNVSLSWSPLQDAISYKIYRETTFFTSISGLTALATTSNNQYGDPVNSTGNYYYAIAAVNEYGDSQISNVEFVEVQPKGLFGSMDYGELIIIAGIVIGLQLVFSLITYFLISKKVQSVAKPKRGKKK